MLNLVQRGQDSNHLAMKTLLIVLLTCVQGVLSAQIVGAEYFWYDDPGPGNGITIEVDADDESIVGFEIDATGMEPGIHRLYYRSVDQSGHWSHLEQTWVIIDGISVSAVVAAEYWWDSDPGEGNGTALTLTPGYEVEGAFTISAEDLAPGRHLCAIRVQDETGIWSHHEKIHVIIDDLMIHELVQAEYFWDTDPGVGNGTPVLIDQDENWLEQIEIDNTGLALGDHWLHVRVLDEQGHWSHYARDLITICTSWPAVSNWDSSIDGVEWTCTDMSENADSLSWSIGGVEQSTDSDFTFTPEGPTEVCLTAFSTCGDSTYCAMVGFPALLTVDPVTLPNTGSYSVDLTGYALDSLSQVEIRSGIETITASNVTFTNSTMLVADFDFDDETVGLWDVVVILENENQLILEEGLELTQSVGIEEPTESGISVFPIPADDQLRMMLDCHALCETGFSVYDAVGRVIVRRSITSGSVLLNTSSWTEGVYILSFHLNDKLVTRRVVIHH